MCKTLNRLLCLLLSAVLLLGLTTPAAAAVAEDSAKAPVLYAADQNGNTYAFTDSADLKFPETEAEATDRNANPGFPGEDSIEAPTLDAIEQDQWTDSNYYFTSFEDLKELAAKTYSKRTYWYYKGEGELVIEEDLTLPEAEISLNSYHTVENFTVRVPAGVTLSIPAKMKRFSFYVDTLVVEGTLTTEYNAYLDIEKELNVAGKFDPGTQISLKGDTKVTGVENIDGYDGYLNRHYNIETLDELKAAVSTMAGYTDSIWGADIFFMPKSDVTINEKIVAPANVRNFSFYSDDYTVTIGENGAIHSYAEYGMSIGCNMVVKGSLGCFTRKSSSWMPDPDISISNYSENFTITFTETGKLEGMWPVTMYADNVPNASDLLPGLDMSNTIVESVEDYGRTYWYVYPIVQLAAPTDLTWGYGLDWDYSSNPDGEERKVAYPGDLLFRVVEPTSDNYIVKRYKVGQKEPETEYGTISSSHRSGEWHYISSDYPESGDYYYTLQTKGNGKNLLDSEVVTSEVWTYNMPPEVLPAPTNARWDGENVRFDPIEDETYVRHYFVSFTYYETPGAEPKPVHVAPGVDVEDNGLLEWTTSFINNYGYGEGYYTFRVWTRSADITKYLHSYQSVESNTIFINKDGVIEDRCDHSYGEWTVTKEATCSEAGVKERKCVHCGLSEQASIPTIAHKEETVKGYAATCTQEGLTDGKKCSVCGKVTAEQKPIPMIAHKEETVKGQAATCTQEGLTDGKKCSVCGTVTAAQETIPMIPHTEIVVEGQEPTCTQEGFAAGKKCSVCGTILEMQETIPMLPHTEEVIPGKAATCSEIGLTEGKKCSVCGTILLAQEEIPMLPHTEEILPGKEPTCTEPGLTEGKKCSVCQTILLAQEEIPALGHDFVDDVCTRCGEENLQIELIRIAGEGRCQTAMEAADELKKLLNVDKFQTIIVADGNNYPDALSGSYLAAVTDAPILLVQTNQKKTTQAVKEYILANLTADATVYILGGTNSIPQDFEDYLSNAGFTTKRLGGDDRYQTSMMIIQEGNQIKGAVPNELLVCTGVGYADSLSASATGKPVLLVNGTKTSLTTSQKNYLAQAGKPSIYVIGGPNSVSEAILNELSQYGNSVKRISGNGREETSAAVAYEFFPNAEFVVLADGNNYPDGLSGGPVAYAKDAPLLLIRAKRESHARDYVGDRIKNGYIMGGPNSVSDNSAKAIFGENAIIK